MATGDWRANIGAWRDVKTVMQDVIKNRPNDVPKNGLIARINGNWTSYCYKIDKKVKL
jgi:hypothetical protein